jgi:hypothetical protein
MWLSIVLGLASSAFMYAAGRFDWLGTGRHRVWREARAHFDAETQALTEQLGNDERELSRRREVEHAEIHDPRRWNNGAGYQSRTTYDSPPERVRGNPRRSMKMRKLASALGVLALMVAGVLAFTGPAQAAQIDGWTANVGTTIEAVDGVNVLVMDQSETSAGTSLERVVAGNVHNELVIEFSFRLDGADAACGGGAPRVYLLGGALYGQVSSCPAASSGWVTVTAADLSWWTGGTNHADWAAAVVAHQGTPLGQVGLVFDNAAGKDAKALFKGLTLAGKRVRLGVPPTQTPSTTPPVTDPPTTSPTTESPDPVPTTPPDGPDDPTSGGPADPDEPGAPVPTVSTSPASGGGGLALTGAPLFAIGAVGLLSVAAGVGAVVLFRRRRAPRFTA